ncbi:unnamed protein product, partial [Polarella glacialis]
AAVAACEKGRRSSEAQELLEEMSSVRLQPDVISWSAVISSFARTSQGSLALVALEDMRQDGISPNSVTINAAISACEKSLLWQQAMHLLRCLCQGARCDVVSFAAAISAC